jgi:arsenate reductase (glutaredoxin)
MKKQPRVVVYEKPTCTTCREVKRVLSEKGVTYDTVHYFEKPFTSTELKSLLNRAGLKPQEVIRKNEPAFKEHVSGKDLTDAQLIDLMVEHPELIQRPIVVCGDKAVLARPIARLSELGIE